MFRACLSLAFLLAGCSNTQPSRTSPPEPPARLMPDGKQWTLQNLNAEIPGSFCFNDDDAYCARYGRLYTWAAAHEVCASLGGDWRLPGMEDFRQLARAFGGVARDGSSDGKAAFHAMLAGGTSGLEMLLGGGRKDGEYARLEAHGFYWSTTEESQTTARLLNFGSGSGAVFDQDGGKKASAYSVRCVSDGQ